MCGIEECLRQANTMDDSFSKVHYARRDIAQRVKTTQERNHIDDGALSRIDSVRERLLFGLHAQGFYDG